VTRSLRTLAAIAAAALAGALASAPLASPARAAEAFGVETFGMAIETESNTPATRAGSHPYALTSTIMFDHTVTIEEEEFEENAEEEELPVEEPAVYAHIYGNPRRLELNLPAGLVVNPTATSVRCTEAQLETGSGANAGCPAASAVGLATLYLNGLGAKTKAAVYDMAPPPGVPAELGLNVDGLGFVVHLVGGVRTGGDYGFTGEVAEISQAASIYGLGLTLWGDPSAASHDAQRGGCASSGPVKKEIEEEAFELENREKGEATREYHFSCPVKETGMPLLTLPGSCTGEPLETALSVDSWQEPGALDAHGAPDLSDSRWKTATASASPVSGCEEVPFAPALTVQPSPRSPKAESPTGMSLDLKIPREEGMHNLAPADLKSLLVTLPAGMAVSAPVAGGLGACTGTAEPGRPEGEIALHSAEPASCPEAAKLGEAEASTPLLGEPLKGAVYLAQQGAFEGSLIALYVVLEGGGVDIKLAARAALDPSSGQIALTLEDAPQVPLQELHLSLFGGPRAPLQAPSACGTYTISAQLEPWSGTSPVRRDSRFTIDSGCEHPFAPSFTAGSADSRAGGSSAFSVTISRQDREQRLARASVVAPPGLMAALKDVERCPDAQAAGGECPAASMLGEATLALGPGEAPYWIEGGRIYLTGPYEGAPFGLAIAIPALAGPFDLGTVVVRARVEVDSHTAQIVIASDPLPTILQGVPLDIRTINLTIDRTGFILNPTDCSRLSVTGTLYGGDGANAAVSSPFRAVDCGSLPFKPKLTASTRARTSRKRGASLRLKVALGAGGANLAKVRVILPERLPARLTTLQNACLAGTFDADPASCPGRSVVGTAKASTPLLAHPLTGRAYLIARPGSSPDLVLVLSGEGITLYLDGNLEVKKRLVSATFNSIPDVPIGSLVATFPEGRHSIFASSLPAWAKGCMCKRRLRMLTELVAQNGARRTQSTKIAVTGCHKKRKARAGHRATRAGHRGKRGGSSGMRVRKGGKVRRRGRRP
jgi:hypothetical protein